MVIGVSGHHGPLAACHVELEEELKPTPENVTILNQTMEALIAQEIALNYWSVTNNHVPLVKPCIIKVFRG
jgi:hypothetical protein